MTLGAAADCERVIGGVLGQPVNTITCLAFLIGALVIWQKSRDFPTALLVASVGVGSIAFHGPMPPGAEFLHDVTIVWVLTWIVLHELGRIGWWPVAFALGGVVSATAALANVGQALIAAGVVAVQVRSPGQRRRRLLILTLAATGAIVGRLSATGGPLCVPDSIWQGHGWWHVSAAAALTLWRVYVHPAEPWHQSPARSRAPSAHH